MSEILGTAYSGWATEQSFFDSRRGKEISLYSQTADNGGSGARPASHSFGIWATSPWMQRPAVKIPTYLGLVPKLCMTAAVVPPPPPPACFHGLQTDNFVFTSPPECSSRTLPLHYQPVHTRLCKTTGKVCL